ncbi:MAG: hypothetical protein Q9191_004449, partial [Dirinaria sp. TL-2023a]
MGDAPGRASVEKLSITFDAWHVYRFPALVTIPIVLLAIRIFLDWRTRRSKPIATSPNSSSQRKIGNGFKSPPEGESKALSGVQLKLPISHTSIVHNAGTATEVVKERPRKLANPKRVLGSRVPREKTSRSKIETKLQPLIFFSSLTGTTEKSARQLAEDLGDTRAPQSDSPISVLAPELHDLSYIEYDDYFTKPPKPNTPQLGIDYFYLLVIPTYNIDTVLNNFTDHLRETHHDFRIDTAPLSGLAGYSVFGFGDKESWKTEEEGFCSQAVEVDKWMAKLTGRKRAFPLGLGDVKSDSVQRLAEWREGVRKTMSDIAINGHLGEGVPGSGDPLESDGEAVKEASLESMGNSKSRPFRRKVKKNSSINDLEDLGDQARSSPPIPTDFTTVGKPSSIEPEPEPKEMVPVSSPTHAALTKQGYAIIGSHSGVKICRWTKSALRGRGSCYKYSFYGIQSHLCMETTPSLSCSNKCVFCWRHGTNPVGTTWRWKVDPPDMIFEQAKAAHLQKIKMMRGVPGVRAERFQEALRIRHCALSLVGEPIFYPHINEFLHLLHSERISSFLVCNAQHPEQLRALKPVTQLYVSIDASNERDLRRIDRPLHRDSWTRFQSCLDILREKRTTTRTVFRLTLVKGFNLDDNAASEYAALVARGLPCFIEIKGVTYCGSSSSSSGLTMQNVPFYTEIAAFARSLHEALRAREGLDYGIAAEHAHSCCILLADTRRFFINGAWCTRIDYEG